MADCQGHQKAVDVKVSQDITQVTFSRPEKHNAISLTLNSEVIQVFGVLELDADAKVLVLTDADDAWTASIDLKEYLREVDAGSEILQEKIRRDACQWRQKLLRMYTKPTIAVVNGWCFGGGFSSLVAYDLAIVADEAIFGLSEINWGILPGSLVNKAIADTVGHHQALYCIMTGEAFTGQQAAAMSSVNESVPRTHLRARTMALAEKLLEKNPVVLCAAKHGFRHSRELTWEQNEDCLYAKLDQTALHDSGGGREQSLKRFLSDRSVKSGLQAYKRT